MTAESFKWFRSWHGAPTDNKWLVIARRANVTSGIVSAVAWALLDYASQNNDRGSIAGFDAETYAAWSGFENQAVEAVIAAMRDKGVIDGDRLTNWEKRQPKREDDSTPRVRALRARQEAELENVTQCNAAEHIVTKSNALDIELDSDSELRTSSGVAPQLANVWDLYCQRFSEVFRQYPPGTMTPDDGTFAALVARGLTLAQVDAGITASLEGFKPSKGNPYPKSWRYCLPAIARTLEPKPARSNGYAPPNRDLDAILGITNDGKQTDDSAIVEAGVFVLPERGRETRF